NMWRIQLISSGGRIRVKWDRYWMPVHNATVIELQQQQSMDSNRYRAHNWDLVHQTWFRLRTFPPEFGGRFGFSWYRGEQLRPKDPIDWTVVFPDWLAVVIFAVPPALVVR